LTQQISAYGPLLDLMIGVSAPRMIALSQANVPLPAPIPIRALIDTGANGSCVDRDILKQLGVSPTGTVSIHTPSTGSALHMCNQFDVSFMVTAQNFQRRFDAIAVIEADLATQGIQALIGRDVLSMCLFVYDGTAGTFSLAF
jgi:predicted aspartyl protease